MVELTWTQEISEPGTYWYVDVDYTTPVQIEVEEDYMISLDGSTYTLDELLAEAGHFAGPINIELPIVPDEVIARLDEKRELIIAIAEG